LAIIDISVPLHNSQIVWPSDPPIHIERLRSLERDGANVSRLALSLHSGTHVDPPLHFVAGGRASDQLDLQTLIGPADVVDLQSIPGHISAADLEAAVPGDCTRLLLRTRNSLLWAAGVTHFHEDYVALTAEGAQWVIDRGLRLIGIDYLSIEPYKTPGHPIHRALLGAGIAVLETINLATVAPGRYQLVCLPLLISGGEGAPARAVLLA